MASAYSWPGTTSLGGVLIATTGASSEAESSAQVWLQVPGLYFAASTMAWLGAKWMSGYGPGATMGVAASGVKIHQRSCLRMMPLVIPP